MSTSDAITQIITLANEVREYWGRELPKHHPHYPIIDIGESPPPDPPQRKELEGLFSSLTDQQVYRILLVMYLGRGDFEVGQLSDEFVRLRKAFPNREWAESQMLCKAPLGDYLSDGTSTLGLADVDIDDVSDQKVAVP